MGGLDVAMCLQEYRRVLLERPNDQKTLDEFRQMLKVIIIVVFSLDNYSKEELLCDIAIISLQIANLKLFEPCVGKLMSSFSPSLGPWIRTAIVTHSVAALSSL